LLEPYSIASWSVIGACIGQAHLRYIPFDALQGASKGCYNSMYRGSQSEICMRQNNDSFKSMTVNNSRHYNCCGVLWGTTINITLCIHVTFTVLIRVLVLW
jgi:hypothetical protein